MALCSCSVSETSSYFVLFADDPGRHLASLPGVHQTGDAASGLRRRGTGGDRRPV